MKQTAKWPMMPSQVAGNSFQWQIQKNKGAVIKKMYKLNDIAMYLC